MLNFIICEDNAELRKINEELINKVMFNNNFEYKIFLFESYNFELEQLINTKLGKKIYLLDIELEGKSGIEIATEIRKKDWDSIILMATAHTEMFPDVFKKRLMLFDFVSKFDNYTKNLTNSIEEIIKIYSNKLPFCFNIRKSNYQIDCEEITYLIFDKIDRKTHLKTLSNNYEISKSLKSLANNLPDHFIKINNHCVINKHNVKEISSNGFITFVNNEKLNEFINKEIKINVFS